MNFEYSEEQVLLKESIERWTQDNYNFEQRRVATESDDGFSRDNWATFAELGWLSVPFAEEFGGYDGSLVDLAAIMLEFGKALVVEPVVPNLVMFGGLLSGANNTTAKQLIPSIISGELLGAAAIYEPQARFDASNIACSAVAEDGHYILNGSKSVVLAGQSAEKFIVAARTSGAQTDESGISLFILDADKSGLTRSVYKLMDGQRVADIELSDVSVSADDLVSEVGQGYPMIEAMLQQLHVALSAEAVGIMQKLNATTIAYTKTRQQFGVPISKFQALQHRMVDTFMAYEQSNSLLIGTLCELTDSSTDEKQAKKMVSALRTLVAKNGKLIGDEAIQLHGGMGITDELDVGHYVKRLIMINLLFGNGDFFQKQYNQLAYSA